MCVPQIAQCFNPSCLRLSKGCRYLKLVCSDHFQKTDHAMSPPVSDITRRRFLVGTSLAVAVGMPVPFAQHFPKGLSPILLADDTDPLIASKPGLKVLGDRPYNLETPAHLLDDDATPADRLFVRNNGVMPYEGDIDPAQWRLIIDGEVERPLSLTLADLKARFETVTLRLQLECGGNGRRFYQPSANGNQWSFGAVGCPDWTGVRLRDVLQAAGLTSSAVYTAHYGADGHLSGDPKKVPISRGVPVEKAMDSHNLIAWAMNGSPLPLANGYPLRLVVPGWPGSCSQKWLTRITVRDRVHDGPKMTGQSYRVPKYPVAPGTKVPDEDMAIIQSMPVKSLTTFPQTGVSRPVGSAFEVRGHAWAGDRSVAAVHTSFDFGATWQKAHLGDPANPYAWQRFRNMITLPQPGYYEIWVRATDSAGIAQPATPPHWNPRGYLNNMQHRIAVFGV